MSCPKMLVEPQLLRPATRMASSPAERGLNVVGVCLSSCTATAPLHSIASASSKCDGKRNIPEVNTFGVDRQQKRSGDVKLV
jgi:hypothetical protein